MRERAREQGSEGESEGWREAGGMKGERESERLSENVRETAWREEVRGTLSMLLRTGAVRLCCHSSHLISNRSLACGPFAG